jgi:tRNA pseudouridine13 synthase
MAQAVAARVATLGFPNYFGEQRFGVEGETAALGLDLLTGRKSPRDIAGSRRKFLLRLGLSAVQSALFNQALAERLTGGLLHRVLPGDVMQVTASGGKFLVDDAAVEQRRFEARETVITGPMFGPKMHQPAGEPAERERRLLERFGLTAECFRQFKSLTPGTRRPYLVWPQEFAVEQEAEGIRFHFTLPSGSYATVLLREFMKTVTAVEDAD